MALAQPMTRPTKLRGMFKAKLQPSFGKRQEVTRGYASTPPQGFFQDMNDRLRLLRILGDQRPSVRDARRTVMVILGDLRPSGRDARPSKKEVRNSDGRLAEKDVLQRSRVLRSEAAAVALLRPHIL